MKYPITKPNASSPATLLKSAFLKGSIKSFSKLKNTYGFSNIGVTSYLPFVSLLMN